MSYLGNTPGVSSQRTVLEEVVSGSPKSAFVPSSGYIKGYVDVLVNGIEVDSNDFTAADGITVTLASAAAVGDTVKIKAYLPRGLSDGYLKSEADAKFAALVDGNIIVAPNPGGTRVIGAASSTNTTVVIQAGAASGGGPNIELTAAGTIFNDSNTHKFRSLDAATEYATINSNGLVLPAGKGIDFSASSNLGGMTGEILDDYEHGSWTPTIDASAGVSGLSPGNHFYIKVGKHVTVYGEINFTSATVGANYIVLRVPFNHNQAGSASICGVCNTYPADNNRQSGIVIDNSSGDAYGTYLGFYVSSTGSGSVKWSLTYQSA